MRRLLFISNLFPDAAEPYRGLDNAELLHRLAQRWQVGVLALRPTLPWQRGAWEPRREDLDLKPLFVRTPYLPKIGSRVNVGLMARTLRPLLQERARETDVVMSSWLFPDGCAVARLAEELKLPLVAIAQGSDVHQYLAMPARRRAILRATESMHALVTRSAELAELLAGAGVARAKLRPILNGTDPEIFHPGDLAEARKKLGWPADLPVLLFVGNFYQIKNPLLLVEAMAQVCREPRLALTKLVMVGGGPLENATRRLVERLRLSRHVQFAGRLSAPAVATLMQAADVLALPSDYEGVPNVVLEAFACGLPVVASRVGGLPEVHAGQAHGRLVERRALAVLASTLRAVLLKPPPREPIAAHGRRFTWERTLAEYEAVLNEAIDASPTPPSR